MPTFYDEWLGTADVIAGELAATPAVAKDADIPWVSTAQDANVKLMIGGGIGFATMGSNVLKAEIPVGWHTGRHRHGEESMHILQGTGFTVVEGRRFDWHEGSTIQIPYRAEHQHFNTGAEPVLTVSGMIFDLERFVRLAAVEQLDVCGPNTSAHLDIEPHESEYYPSGDRAVIHLEHAPIERAEDEEKTYGSLEPQGDIPAVRNQHDFLQYLVVPGNGFRADSVAVTHRWIEPPFHHSGRHAHLEAVVYAVEGRGTTEMNGLEVEWAAGDVLYVPPTMWEHEHTNDNAESVTQLRIGFGIRQWFTDLWPEGYTNRRVYDEFGDPIEAGPIIRDRERRM